MEFVSGEPSVVRSIKQRDLLNAWLRMYAAQQRLPDFAHYSPDRMADELPDIIHCSVDGATQPPVLTIRKDAMRMVPAFSNKDMPRRLDEFVGARMATVIMPVWFMCIGRALPVYTISEVTDTQGRPVAYERLLLPFSNNGRDVTDVIGSLKAISDDGRFEIADLMRGTGLPSQPKLRAVIDRNLMVRVTPKRAVDDVIELS